MYAAQLCKLALSERLCDVVCRINDKPVQRRLLAETNFPFGQALKLALVIESAYNNTKDLQGKSSRNQGHRTRGRRSKTRAADEATACYRCPSRHAPSRSIGSKVKAIRGAPLPLNITELKAYRGHPNNYNCFLPCPLHAAQCTSLLGRMRSESQNNSSGG